MPNSWKKFFPQLHVLLYMQTLQNVGLICWYNSSKRKLCFKFLVLSVSESGWLIWITDYLDVITLTSCPMLAAILESSFPVSHSFNAPLKRAGTVNTGIYVAPRGCSIVPIKENVFPMTSLCPANPRPGGGGGDLNWLVHYPNINWAFHAFSQKYRFTWF